MPISPFSVSRFFIPPHLNLVLISFSLGGLLLATTHTGLVALADTFHLQNGHAQTGKFKEIVGEWIFFETPQKQRVRLKRLEMASRLDRIETKRGQVYEGEINYGNTFNIEIRTKNGVVFINRWKIKEIAIGLPLPVIAPSESTAALGETPFEGTPSSIRGQEGAVNSSSFPAEVNPHAPAEGNTNPFPSLQLSPAEGNDTATPSINSTPAVESLQQPQAPSQ